jgi:hypothetical protein
MQFFYDGQIRRYITQTIRVLSNFVVQYGDGTLVRIPVIYGDQDRQAASIINQNSENTISSAPRIAVYVGSLELDRERLSDSTYVGKLNFRERDTQVDMDPMSPTYGQTVYNQNQGRNYTVERLMPTPYKLTIKVDIWSSSTEQKLQILEQILVLFNPSLELQTTDNYIDWTSLSVLNLDSMSWSSRQVPVGTNSPIDIATLTLITPIWISPPVKVKHLGVITRIVTNLWANTSTSPVGYIDGLGQDPAGAVGTTSFSDLLWSSDTTIGGWGIQVYAGQAQLLNPGENVLPAEPTLDKSVRQGTPINWQTAFDQYPGKYIAGSSMLYLIQPNGTYVVGTIAINPLDNTILQVNWNPDTLTSNTGIDSTGKLDTDGGYNAAGSYRPNSPGTFDAIINPQTYDPKRPTGTEETDQAVAVGTRFLIVEDLGSQDNPPGTGPSAWQSTTGTDFIAKTNDIIEWTGTHWNVIFNAIQESDTMVWQTNIYTGVQYLWNGVSWVKSFEGEYGASQWKIVL